MAVKWAKTKPQPVANVTDSGLHLDLSCHLGMSPIRTGRQQQRSTSSCKAILQPPAALPVCSSNASAPVHVGTGQPIDQVLEANSSKAEFNTTAAPRPVATVVPDDSSSDEPSSMQGQTAAADREEPQELQTELSLSRAPLVSVDMLVEGCVWRLQVSARMGALAPGLSSHSNDLDTFRQQCTSRLLVIACPEPLGFVHQDRPTCKASLPHQMTVAVVATSGSKAAEPQGLLPIPAVLAVGLDTPRIGQPTIQPPAALPVCSSNASAPVHVGTGQPFTQVLEANSSKAEFNTTAAPRPVATVVPDDSSSDEPSSMQGQTAAADREEPQELQMELSLSRAPLVSVDMLVEGCVWRLQVSARVGAFSPGLSSHSNDLDTFRQQCTSRLLVIACPEPLGFVHQDRPTLGLRQLNPRDLLPIPAVLAVGLDTPRIGRQQFRIMALEGDPLILENETSLELLHFTGLSGAQADDADSMNSSLIEVAAVKPVAIRPISVAVSSRSFEALLEQSQWAPAADVLTSSNPTRWRSVERPLAAMCPTPLERQLMQVQLQKAQTTCVPCLTELTELAAPVTSTAGVPADGLEQQMQAFSGTGDPVVRERQTATNPFHPTHPTHPNPISTNPTNPTNSTNPNWGCKARCYAALARPPPAIDNGLYC
eukprot:gene7021-7235_t